jgi:hypothetical protein
MATTKDLIDKGCIDIEDYITFRTHANVLRLFAREGNSPKRHNNEQPDFHVS